VLVLVGTLLTTGENTYGIPDCFFESSKE
jgi:hypothetical protein